MFWTDGSVDMLLLPYYASVKGHHSPWFRIALLGKWAGAIPASAADALVLLLQVAKAADRLVHSLEGARGVSGVVERLLSDARAVEGEMKDGGLMESAVFSIIHLPRSEYVDTSAPLTEAMATRELYGSCAASRRHHSAAARGAPLLFRARRQRLQRPRVRAGQPVALPVHPVLESGASDT